MGAEEVRSRGVAVAGGEGSEEVYSIGGADTVDTAVFGVCLERGLGVRADSGEFVWTGGVRDGGGGVQGQMVCGAAGGDSERVQFVGE